MSGWSDAPPFWWKKSDWRARLLWPISAAYGAIASARMEMAKREAMPAAILCVGNFSVGGEGKTPLSIALAKEAKRQKMRVGFLSRGYGGRTLGPHLVNAECDSARVVGDEPLLLARIAPTVISANRAAGARRLLQEGCDFIVMDDGFQSARIHMDYALIVVDARRGLGNGHVIPGGPLRAPLTRQLRYVDAIVTMGSGDAAEPVVRRASRAGRPVFSAHLRPSKAHEFEGKQVLAFAGIGNPEKFYSSLREAGAELVTIRSFPDHHPFSEEEISELKAEAAANNLVLVTTEKDLVRLRHGSKPVHQLASSVRVFPVEAVFEGNGTAAAIVRETHKRWRERML